MPEKRVKGREKGYTLEEPVEKGATPLEQAVKQRANSPERLALSTKLLNLVL